MRTKFVATFIALAASFSFTIHAQANQIGSQATLNAILGASAASETFSAANPPAGSAYTLVAAQVDTANGLTRSDIIFTSSSGGFQFDGAGYYGATSNELLALPGAPGVLRLNFLNMTTAFGIDLRAFEGFADTAVVTVLAADDLTALATVNVPLTNDGSSTFFGWQSAGGIGAVSFSPINMTWSPIVSNLTYGNASDPVPEPATLALMGLGLAGLVKIRRRAMHA